MALEPVTEELDWKVVELLAPAVGGTSRGRVREEVQWR